MPTRPLRVTIIALCLLALASSATAPVFTGRVDVTAKDAPGAARALFKLEDSLGYAVLPDGKRFVLCRPIDPVPTPTITVVLNWAEGLKRQ